MTGKNFLLINALSKRVLLFFSGQLSYKSNRKLFSCAIYPDMNTRGVGINIAGYICSMVDMMKFLRPETIVLSSK